MPQHGSKETIYCLDLSDKYIENWSDILAKSLNGNARVQEIDKLPFNITCGNHVYLLDNIVVSNEKIKQVCVIYDEGYFILTGQKDTSNKWSILIGHIFETTNHIKHQEIDKVIYSILRKLTINETYTHFPLKYILYVLTPFLIFYTLYILYLLFLLVIYLFFYGLSFIP
jgi:hypothetical protein